MAFTPQNPSSAQQAPTQTNHSHCKLLSPLCSKRSTFFFKLHFLMRWLCTNTSTAAAFHLWGHWHIPMKVKALRSLHDGTGLGFTLLPKQHFTTTGGRCECGSRQHQIFLEDVRELEMLENQVAPLVGSMVVQHGTSLFIRVASLCSFFWQRTRAESD